MSNEPIITYVYTDLGSRASMAGRRMRLVGRVDPQLVSPINEAVTLLLGHIEGPLDYEI